MRVRTPAHKASKEVRLPSDRTDTLLEKFGRDLAPTLSQDFAGSIAATALGRAEIVRRIGQIRATTPPMLLVPDAGSLARFLKNARVVYRQAHPPSKRGPKFLEGKALVVISDLEKTLRRRPTRKEIIARLTDNVKYGANTVSPRTAEKCSKLYFLINRRKWKVSKAEARWLRKNFGPKSVSPHWWSDKRRQWLHDRLDATGLSKEVRDIF